MNNKWVGFSEVIVKQTSDGISPFFVRDIIVESTMKMHCNILGKQYDLEKISILKQHIECIEDLSHVIQSISKYKLCQGLNSWHVSKYFSVTSGVSTNILKVDSTGTYRHTNCQFLLNIGNKCTNCARALKTISETVERLLLNSPKRLKFKVTFTKRKMLERLQKKSEIIRKKTKRQENRITILKNDLSESVKKLESMVTSDITEKLKANNFPDYQQVIIKEILAATKV